MEGHRIGVISDTHGILRPEAEAVLNSCEVILHAGDLGKPEILGRLRAAAAAYAVRGNVDSVPKRGSRICEEDRGRTEDGRCTGGFLPYADAAYEELPEELETELFGFRIYMVHNKKQIRKDLSGVDIVIVGHSHKYEVGSIGGVICLNPGSCGPRRFRLPVTMMVLTLYPDEHRLETEKIDLLSVQPKTEKVNDLMMPGTDQAVEIPERNLHTLVREIMKEADAGRNIADIAARNRIDEAFAEQVCRMYLTHPGVDVDGILDRMERRNL